MKKANCTQYFLIFLIILTIISCTNDGNEDSSIPSPLNLPKVSDIYTVDTMILEQNNISFEIDQLQNSNYLENFISSVIQLNDYDFNYVCHLTYDSDGYVNYYKINSTNQGTIQRDNNGNVLSTNNTPISIENNRILFKESHDGWSDLYYNSASSYWQVDYDGRKLIKTSYKDSQGNELPEHSYTYNYNGNNLTEKFGYYQISEYYDEDFNLPWVIFHSDTRIALELIFGFRLMKKLPKKTNSFLHPDQAVEITTIIKDNLDRIILLVGENLEDNNYKHIVIYQYAE